MKMNRSCGLVRGICADFHKKMAFDEFELSLKRNWKIKSSGEATRADLQVRDKRWDESYSKTGAVLIWVIKKGET